MWQAYFLIIYTLMSLLVALFIYNSQKKFYTEMMITKKDDPTPISIHKEFEVFSRKDKLSFPWLFLGTFFLFWIRFILSLIIASTLLIILLYKLRHLKTKDVISREERESFKFWIQRLTMMFMYASGVLVIYNKPDVEKIYKEYFGNDYKIEYDSNYACFISNHISFIDSLMGMRTYGTGFLSKESVKRTPIIGPLTTSLQSVYVDRSNQTDREKVLKQILECQSDFLNGKRSTPIMIFPEGTTTSGRDLLQFKKGAFAALLPLKPVLIKGNSNPNFHHGCGSSDVFINYMRGLTQLYTIIEYNELPIMEPTEYMYEHYKHFSKKNEQWEIFAEVAREIYCKVGGFNKSDRTLRDSTRYTNSMDSGKYVEAS